MQGISDVFQRHKKDFILCFKTTDEIIVDYKPDLHSRKIMVKKEIVIESNETAPLEIKMCDQQENGLKTIEEKFSKHEDAKTSSSPKSNVECPMQLFSLHDESKISTIKESLEQVYNNLNENLLSKEKVNKISTKIKKSFQTVNIENAIIVDSSQNVSYVASCRFCRKSFKSVVSCKRHACNQSKNVGRNSCKICSVQLTNRKALCKHLKSEHNISEPLYLYKCNFCERAFCKQSSLNSHLKSHGESKFVCIKCGFMCLVEEEYADHIKEHKKPIKFECSLCNKQFVRNQQFKQHMMLHKQYFCPPCDVSFSTKKLLIQHQCSHHGLNIVKKYECPICKKSFIRPFHLKVHLRCHTGEKPVKCYLCNKNFANQQSFKKHMKSAMHLKKSTSAEKVELNKTFLCSICGAKFFRLQTLRRHIETIHLPGEVFKCPHCDYSTKFKANFVRHKEGHFNIKRYVCELCGASFRALGTLQEHQTFVHSDCRNFSCDTCGKAFKNKSTLQRHLRIHKDERPYKCHCTLSYKRLSHLKRHLAAAHGITPEKGLKKISIFNKDSSSNVAPFGGVQGLTSNNAELDSQNENCSENNFPDRDEQTVPLIKSSIDDDQSDYNSYKNVVNLSEESIPAIDLKSTEKQLPSPSALSVMLSDTQDSITLEDHNLVASPSTYNLPATGPLKLNHSVHSDQINRPHSLPNLNFQTYINETYFPISVDNIDISCSNPPFSILDKEEPSPAHEHLFEDITNFNPTSDSEIIESSSDIFFSVSKSSDSWNPKANRMSSAFGNFEITEDSYNKIPSTLSEFSNNFSSTYSPLLACNLVFPDDPLMECTIDADSFNTDDFVLQ